MPTPFDDILCGRIPFEALPLLAALRCEPGLRVALLPPHAWLRWDAGSERVIESVMPINGAVLFRFHDGRWHRFAHALPDFTFPPDLDYRALAHVLFPAAVQTMPAQAFAGQPMRLTLERDDRPRATTAILCPLATFARWSDGVPTARLASLLGAILDEQMLLVGKRLPTLDNGQRFWGTDVLVPLGLAPQPELPESALLAAAGVSVGDLLVWQPDHAEMIPRSLLTPLTRAGLRLAAREARR